MTEEVEKKGEEVTPVERGGEAGGEESSFPASYVRELRAENARRRANERKLEGTLKELASMVGAKEGEGEMEGLSARVKAAMEAGREGRALAEEVLVGSKFKELVAERGVVDADAAGRLVDMSGVKVDLARREVAGLEEAMDALLSERPYLVGRPVPGGTPGGGTPRATRGGGEDTLAGRVKQEFARRLPSGMSVPGTGLGNMRIS